MVHHLNPTMKRSGAYPRLTIVFCAAILFSSVLGSASASTTTRTTNETFSIDLFVWVPCANGGDGEYIQASGPLKVLFHTTETSKGQFLVESLFNPEGISGQGLTTGDTYHATGITQFKHIENKGIQDSYVNQFNIVGDGPDNNFTVRENMHFVVNADGTVSGYHDSINVSCR
jgi:hypothetical protein